MVEIPKMEIVSKVRDPRTRNRFRVLEILKREAPGTLKREIVLGFKFSGNWSHFRAWKSRKWKSAIFTFVISKSGIWDHRGEIGPNHENENRFWGLGITKTGIDLGVWNHERKSIWGFGNHEGENRFWGLEITKVGIDFGVGSHESENRFWGSQIMKATIDSGLWKSRKWGRFGGENKDRLGTTEILTFGIAIFL
jgi:hypothetical protein